MSLRNFDPTKKKIYRKIVLINENNDYFDLLKRIYAMIKNENNVKDTNQKSTQFIFENRFIESPIVEKEGTKKVAWKNFQSCCHAINRNVQHVLLFVLSELGTTGNISDIKGLVIRGRYSALNFEQLLKKYIQAYVTCNSCYKNNTSIKKENRIDFKYCHNCYSSSSVATIKIIK